jgi:hypothetical protein
MANQRDPRTVADGQPGDRPAGPSRWRHRRSGTEVDAIQWTGLNFAAVKAFASGALGLWNTASGVLPLWEAAYGGVRRLEPGDWVVHEPEGGCGRYSGSRFVRIFERADPGAGLRMRPGDQQLPVPTGGPSMHDLVIQDLVHWPPPAAEKEAVAALLAARKQLGLDRYGSLLQAGNQRDWRRDLSEELADAAVYARQGLEELGAGPEHDTLTEAYNQIVDLLLALHRTPGGTP